MNLYIDTSALVKKYVNEEGSSSVIRYWDAAEFVIVSAVAYAELFSAVNRKRREGALSEEEYLQAIIHFKIDWKTVIQIEVANLLNTHIERLTTTYLLRGFDAIHLASALIVSDVESHNLLFIGADRRLNDAARSEHLHVIDLART